MNLLYNLGISLYAAAARVATSFNKKAKLMVEGQRLALPTLARAGLDNHKVLWLHAASLGEFEQGRPLLEMVRAMNPDIKIVLSFFSPSGYEVRKNYQGADAVVYLPFDKPAKMREFIDAVKPDIAIFVKYEFWGNCITTLKKRGVPVYLISAIFRPGQVFFKPWGGQFRKILKAYTHIFVQDMRSAELLKSIGIERVTAAGDTRFDRVKDIMNAHKDLSDIRAFTASAPFTLVVGSSWPQDEDVYIPWLHAHPEVKAICAPHEFDNSRLETLLKKFGDGAWLYSRYLSEKPQPDSVRYLIIDSFGLLSSLYAYGDAAYVGGGFGSGIHNINEAAVYGIPVVFGPRHSKFKEATDLIGLGGGFSINNAHDCAQVLSEMLANNQARELAGNISAEYIRNSIGATERIYKKIFRK
ncbi:MAG: 3-deoxy-D-manno-octulosonic acid transferase [Muribaculaceae bacterium]|nr:3-deoxy-D-manno-octulosonic acid transferase [Muribaculaceae bacterium]